MGIPFPGSLDPSKPANFCEYIFAFLAKPKVIPVAIAATWVP